MIRGYNYSNEFNQAIYLRKDDGATNEHQLLFKLIHRRFDIGIGNTSLIQYLANEKSIGDKIVFLKPYFNSIPQYIAFSKIKNHEHLGRRFADEVKSFKKSSEFHEILKKYGVEYDGWN